MIEVFIDRWNTGFAVRTTNIALTSALHDFNRRYNSPKIDRVRGKVVVVPGDNFFVYDKQREQFVYIKAAWEEVKGFLDHMKSQFRTPIKIDIENKAPKKKGDKVVFDRHTLRLVEDDEYWAWQNEATDLALVDGRRHTVLEVQTGRGKAAYNATEIRIPGGWKKIGDMKVGDVVIGGDGKPTNVIGVYPQGEVDLYDVTFDDGRTVKTCGEHLWQCFYVNTTPKRRWDVRNTLEMKRLISMPNPRVYIPLPEPEETTEKEFPIHPYLLGALLGDGSISQNTIGITKYDVEFLDRVKSHLPAGTVMAGGGNGKDWRLVGSVRGYNPLYRHLKELELQGTVPDTKFIPKQYLEGSIEQRWELLRGLMDTDGTVNKDGGQPSFCSTSKLLALGVQELVRSLGGIASISEKRPFYTHKGERNEGKLAYIVFIRMKKPSMLFHLTRKKELTRDDGQYTKDLKLRVRSIEPCGRGEATCISVDNADSLYVTEGWIVTHNTKSAMKYMVKLGKRVLVITKAGYVDKWQGDLLGGLKPRPGEFVRVKDLDELEDLFLIADAGRMNSTGKGDKDIKVILISSHCIDNYIQRWCSGDFFKVSPYDFIEKLGIGLTVYDESHQLFRMNFWSFIMMDHEHVLDLSATLDPEQDFMKARYKERFPKEARFDLEYDAYVEMYGIYFNWNDTKALTRLNRMSMYNHTEFEKLIMKKKTTENEYFNMLNRLLIPWFFDNWKPGQRALVLFATKEMCTRFTKFIQGRHPGKRVERYIQGDKYDKAKTGDVIVSTRGKSGTAVDYEGLVLNLTTVAVDDIQASLQILGRTRKTTLIEWGIVPKIVFPVCRQVRKQVDYYKRKLKKFEGKVTKALTMGSSFVIH